MKERKYKDQYRVVAEPDARTGSPRGRAEYSGAYYRYPAGSPAPRRRALGLGAGLALFWLFALAYLRLGRTTSRCAYALLPMIAALLPGAYGLIGAFSLLRAPERMTVLHREKGPGRAVRSALGCGILCAAGAVGCAVFLSLSARWGEGWIDCALAAAASAAAWMCFARARRDYNALEAE